MSGRFAAGLGAAVAAALLYGVAPVVQARVARSAPPGRGVGLGLLLRLARRPVWLVALVGEIGGFLAEAYAFSAAPTSVVAPVAACDMLVFVVTGSLVLGYRPSRTGVLGAAATVAGVVLLAVAERDAGLGQPAGTATMILLAAGAVVAAGVLAAVGHRARAGVGAAVAFSLGAGIAYGVATIATRQIGRSFDAHRWVRLFAEPAPYALVACSLVAMGLLQLGLQAGALLTYPIVAALSAFLPVLVGLALLGDPAPPGARRVLLVAGLLLVAAGLGLSGRDRLHAEPQPADAA